PLRGDRARRDTGGGHRGTPRARHSALLREPPSIDVPSHREAREKEAADMTSVWKRLQRVGKKASKFQFVASYHELTVECTKKWQPDKLRVVWTRRSRRICSKLHGWQPGIKNPYRGTVVWQVPENVELTVTLFKDVNAEEFEDKDWTVVIENESRGRRKLLACVEVNLRKYAGATPTQTELMLQLRPLSVKVVEASLKLSLSCIFLKEGKATDEDMQSLASLMSMKHSDIGNLEDFNESDEEEDRKPVAGVTGLIIATPAPTANEMEQSGGVGPAPDSSILPRPPQSPLHNPFVILPPPVRNRYPDAQTRTSPYAYTVPAFVRAHPPALPKIFHPPVASAPMSIVQGSLGGSSNPATDVGHPAEASLVSTVSSSRPLPSQPSSTSSSPAFPQSSHPGVLQTACCPLTRTNALRPQSASASRFPNIPVSSSPPGGHQPKATLAALPEPGCVLTRPANLPSAPHTGTTLAHDYISVPSALGNGPTVVPSTSFQTPCPIPLETPATQVSPLKQFYKPIQPEGFSSPDTLSDVQRHLSTLTEEDDYSVSAVEQHDSLKPQVAQATPLSISKPDDSRTPRSASSISIAWPPSFSKEPRANEQTCATEPTRQQTGLAPKPIPGMAILQPSCPRVARVPGFPSLTVKTDEALVEKWLVEKPPIWEKLNKDKSERALVLCEDLDGKYDDKGAFKRMAALVPCCPRAAKIPGFPSVQKSKVPEVQIPRMLSLLPCCPNIASVPGFPSRKQMWTEEAQVQLWPVDRSPLWKREALKPVIILSSFQTQDKTYKNKEIIQMMGNLLPTCPSVTSIPGFPCAQLPKLKDASFNEKPSISALLPCCPQISAIPGFPSKQLVKYEVCEQNMYFSDKKIIWQKPKKQRLKLDWFFSPSLDRSDIFKSMMFLVPSCPNVASIPGFPSVPKERKTLVEKVQRMENLFPSCPKFSRISGFPSSGLVHPEVQKEDWMLMKKLHLEKPLKQKQVQISFRNLYGVYADRKVIEGMAVLAPSCARVASIPGFPSLLRQLRREDTSEEVMYSMTTMRTSCSRVSRISGFPSLQPGNSEEIRIKVWSFDKEPLWQKPLKHSQVCYLEPCSTLSRLEEDKEMIRHMTALMPCCPREARISGFPSGYLQPSSCQSQLILKEQEEPDWTTLETLFSSALSTSPRGVVAIPGTTSLMPNKNIDTKLRSREIPQRPSSPPPLTLKPEIQLPRSGLPLFSTIDVDLYEEIHDERKTPGSQLTNETLVQAGSLLWDAVEKTKGEGPKPESGMDLVANESISDERQEEDIFCTEGPRKTNVEMIPISMVDLRPTCSTFGKLPGFPSLNVPNKMESNREDWPVDRRLLWEKPMKLKSELTVPLCLDTSEIDHEGIKYMAALSPTCPRIARISGFPCTQLSKKTQVDQVPNMSVLLPCCPTLSTIPGFPSRKQLELDECYKKMWHTIKDILWRKQQKEKIQFALFSSPVHDTLSEDSLKCMMSLVPSCPSVTTIPGFPSVPKPKAQKDEVEVVECMVNLLPLCPRSSKIPGFASLSLVDREIHEEDWSLVKKPLLEKSLKQNSNLLLPSSTPIYGEHVDTEILSDMVALTPSCPTASIPGFPSVAKKKTEKSGIENQPGTNDTHVQVEKNLMSIFLEGKAMDKAKEIGVNMAIGESPECEVSGGSPPEFLGNFKMMPFAQAQSSDEGIRLQCPGVASDLEKGVSSVGEEGVLSQLAQSERQQKDMYKAKQSEEHFQGGIVEEEGLATRHKGTPVELMKTIVGVLHKSITHEDSHIEEQPPVHEKPLEDLQDRATDVVPPQCHRKKGIRFPRISRDVTQSSSDMPVPMPRAKKRLSGSFPDDVPLSSIVLHSLAPVDTESANQDKATAKTPSEHSEQSVLTDSIHEKPAPVLLTHEIVPPQHRRKRQHKTRSDTEEGGATEKKNMDTEKENLTSSETLSEKDQSQATQPPGVFGNPSQEFHSEAQKPLENLPVPIPRTIKRAGDIFPDETPPSHLHSSSHSDSSDTNVPCFQDGKEFANRIEIPEGKNTLNNDFERLNKCLNEKPDPVPRVDEPIPPVRNKKSQLPQGGVNARDTQNEEVSKEKLITDFKEQSCDDRVAGIEKELLCGPVPIPRAKKRQSGSFPNNIPPPHSLLPSQVDISVDKVDGRQSISCEAVPTPVPDECLPLSFLVKNLGGLQKEPEACRGDTLPMLGTASDDRDYGKDVETAQYLPTTLPCFLNENLSVISPESLILDLGTHEKSMEVASESMAFTESAEDAGVLGKIPSAELPIDQDESLVVSGTKERAFEKKQSDTDFKTDILVENEDSGEEQDKASVCTVQAATAFEGER
ncbi:hypothetical protein Z043_104786, partial [Scleropages formosus]